jgi:hypothetical protein
VGEPPRIALQRQPCPGVPCEHVHTRTQSGTGAKEEARC